MEAPSRSPWRRSRIVGLRTARRTRATQSSPPRSSWWSCRSWRSSPRSTPARSGRVPARGVSSSVPLAQIPQGMSVQQFGERLAFVDRDGDHVTVFDTNVHHLRGENGLWWCPREQCSWRRRTPRPSPGPGKAIGGPARAGLDRFRSVVRHGKLIVDLSHLIPGAKGNAQTAAGQGSSCEGALEANNASKPESVLDVASGGSGVRQEDLRRARGTDRDPVRRRGGNHLRVRRSPIRLLPPRRRQARASHLPRVPDAGRLPRLRHRPRAPASADTKQRSCDFHVPLNVPRRTNPARARFGALRRSRTSLGVGSSPDP